jgi:membrane-associated phospholipid phosphatase
MAPPPPASGAAPDEQPAPHGPGTARNPALWAAMTATALAAVLLALVQARWRPLREADGRVARALHEAALDHPGWTQAMRVLTDWVWDTWTMRALLVAAVGVLWWRAHRRLAVRVAVAALVGTALQQTLKAVVGRERPRWEVPVDHAHLSAMPSGHAMTAAMACGLLVWVTWQTTRRSALRAAVTAAAVVSAAGVAYTRVHLGVHWLTDVVVGSLLGVAIAACAAGTWRATAATGRLTP